jgi:hypothetical protein
VIITSIRCPGSVAPGTEDLGSNPARVQGFYELMAMLLCMYNQLNKHCLCVEIVK